MREDEIADALDELIAALKKEEDTRFCHLAAKAEFERQRRALAGFLPESQFFFSSRVITVDEEGSINVGAEIDCLADVLARELSTA